jgi:hypothetical protein
VLERRFAELLGRLSFDDEVLDWVRAALQESHADQRRDHADAIARLRAKHDRFQNRIHAMYVDKLDGRVTDRCSTLGDLGDVVLADLSQYGLGLSPVLSLDRSNAPGWLAAQINLRAIARADGQSPWESPQTPRNGATTVSPFIVLGAR